MACMHAQGVEFFNENLNQYVMKWLRDKSMRTEHASQPCLTVVCPLVYAVRLAAVQILEKLVKLFGLPWAAVCASCDCSRVALSLQC